MAKRPIFLPVQKSDFLSESVFVDFFWHPGLSKQQKQKSIQSLHDSAAMSHGIKRILEISSKSPTDLGVQLSAFNLKLKVDGVCAPVEVLFQGSKIFSSGGPFTDLYSKESIEAKKDRRLKESGDLVGFRFDNRDWPLAPQTVFYDWLYISALRQHPELAKQLMTYDGFSDIEFNPDKSINCQAASAALYKSLVDHKLIDKALSSPEEFIELHASQPSKGPSIQNQLFE